jgi:D-alanine-D-alanine ligase
MRVAVIMGGQSSEHEISLKSGEQVMKALADQNPVPVVIGKNGRWSIAGVEQPTFGQAIDELLRRADVGFIALHGAFGEDGTIQGLFEMVGFPYTGSAVLGSALAMDKVRAKLVYQSRGLPTSPFIVLTRNEWRVNREALLDRADKEIAFPCVIKVARAGSSVGVRFPESRAVLAETADRFMADTELALVERYVKGREFTCGIIEDAKDGSLIALPVTEIVPDSARYAFFDYEAKYTPGATQEITPARIEPKVSERIQALALEAHRWLDCRDFSRTDVILDDRGDLCVLETNTIPGLTAQSLLPQAAAVAGYAFPQLIQLLLENARVRYKRR